MSAYPNSLFFFFFIFKTKTKPFKTWVFLTSSKSIHLCLIIHNIWLIGIYMAFSFSFIHSASSQSRHLWVYLQKFAIGIPQLLSDCCCGLACCRFGHRKGQSSNSSQAWGFFHTYVTRIYQIQMVGTVCNECLGDISAWQEADFSFTRRQLTN